MITVLLGGISMEAPVVAAATGVTVAVLLASRRALHTFTQSTLTDMEVRDGLVLASIGLVVLPVLPNESLGPEGLLNPYRIALIVWLVMAIGAMGHIATRVFGARLGLPLSGFLSGFVSSSATIVTLGRRSASMASAQHTAPRWASAALTVDFPEPIPPVRPTRSMPPPARFCRQCRRSPRSPSCSAH